MWKVSGVSHSSTKDKEWGWRSEEDLTSQKLPCSSRKTTGSECLGAKEKVQASGPLSGREEKPQMYALAEESVERGHNTTPEKGGEVCAEAQSARRYLSCNSKA